MAELAAFEAVQICIFPGDASASAAGRLLDAWVESVALRTRCRLVLKSGQKLDELPGRLLIRKSNAQGLVEIDAVGHALEGEDPVVLVVDLISNARNMQRRESCRIGVVSPARFRNLSLAKPEEDAIWHTAAFNDISLGGASLQLQGEPLVVGHRLLLELTLGGRLFQIPAIVCRVNLRADGKSGCASLQFTDLDRRQQDLLGRALAQEELKLLSRRVRI